MKWSQDDVTDFGIDVSLVGQEVFDVATMPIIYNDISHLTKNAGKTVQDIIAKTCGGDKLGIGNSNKRLLIDHVQHQFKSFYKLEDERTPELWLERVETMLCHLADDHHKCDILECNPEKRAEMKPICHHHHHLHHRQHQHPVTATSWHHHVYQRDRHRPTWPLEIAKVSFRFFRPPALFPLANYDHMRVL